MRTFNFEKGKKALIKHFDNQLEWAETESLMCVKSLSNIHDIGKEVESFQIYELQQIDRINNIRNASTLREIFNQLIDTDLEEDDEMIIDFFTREQDEEEC